MDKLLSDDVIRTLTPREAIWTASDGAGLELEIRPSGRRSWRFRALRSGKQHKVTIGHWPAMGVKAARQRRDELRVAVESGDDAADLERARRKGYGQYGTVAEFAERWMREVVRKRRRDPEDVQRYLKRDILPVLGRRLLHEVRGREVQRLVFARRDAGRPMAAMAIRGVIKRMWEYAIVCGVAEANPAAAAPPAYIGKRKSRERTLSELELSKTLKALNAAQIREQNRLALEIVLATMVRKSMLRLAWWEEFDFEKAEWSIPAERTKMNRAHVVYLAPQVIERLRRLRGLQHPKVEMVLPAHQALTAPLAASALNAALARVEKLARVAHFTVHDLRRTAATQLTEMGWKDEVVEKALSHEIKGVRGIYNRAAFAAERREMLTAWADWLDVLRRRA